MRPELVRCGVEVRGFEPLASSVRERMAGNRDLGYSAREGLSWIDDARVFPWYG